MDLPAPAHAHVAVSVAEPRRAHLSDWWLVTAFVVGAGLGAGLGFAGAGSDDTMSWGHVPGVVDAILGAPPTITAAAVLVVSVWLALKKATTVTKARARRADDEAAIARRAAAAAGAGADADAAGWQRRARAAEESARESWTSAYGFEDVETLAGWAAGGSPLGYFSARATDHVLTLVIVLAAVVLIAVLYRLRKRGQLHSFDEQRRTS
jgi:hypothetical protein